MKWVFTIAALLLLVEPISLFQLVSKAKAQVIQLLCGHENDDETFEGKIEVKEIDKSSPRLNSFTPVFIFFQKSTAYSRPVAMYKSGFSSALYQPPEYVTRLIVYHPTEGYVKQLFYYLPICRKHMSLVWYFMILPGRKLLRLKPTQSLT